MILYHGSNTIIKKIDLNKCKPFKDFGQGFYMTEIKEQAENMARRTSVIFGGTPVINKFIFNDKEAFSNKELNIKRFSEPNEEWAIFVLSNRNRTTKQPIHNYDIVIGPVADDTIATLFRNFNDGIIDLPTLVNGLKYKKVSSQYLFATDKAIQYLKRDE